MASSSSDDMTLDDVAMLEFMNQNTPLRLRCGVRKFVVQPGTGELLSQPYASIIMKFVLYGYDLTVEGKEALKQRKLQARTRRASEEDDLAPLPLAVRRLDSQEAVAVTVGISALLPGLEIGLLSMREGERAIIQIPPGLGFRASLPYRIPNNAVAKDLVAYVVIKQAKPVDLLPCDVLRSFTTRSSGPTPQIDDQVTINLQQPHPTTMVKGARANVTVVIGDSDYDDALLSAPRGSVLSCFINGLEHTIMVTQITPSGRPQPFIRLQATGEGVLSPYEWSDPNVSIDVFSTSRHLRTTLSASDRFSECDRWKQLGRKWIQIKPLKAVQVYRRAAAFLLADPPIVSDTASEAQARRELAVILNNIGRAYKTVDNVTAALDAVETSLRFDMGYGKAHFLLAQLYRQQQRYSAALSELELCAGCADATQAEVAAEKERVLAEQAAQAVSDASDTMGSAAASLD